MEVSSSSRIGCTPLASNWRTAEPPTARQYTAAQPASALILATNLSSLPFIDSSANSATSTRRARAPSSA